MANLQDDPEAENEELLKTTRTETDLTPEPESELQDSQEEVQEDKVLSDAPELFKFPGNPRIVPRTEHPISRKLIDHDALKVMYRLIRNGHKAFLVGGGVRDLLLDRKPKDYDIGTSAQPEEVRRLFRNSRIIGRRFRMNQVYFRGGKIIEVATFRARNVEPVESEEGPQMLAPDNTFGDEESDALRRDLTINGLFYDPNSYAVIDYVGGIEDLKNRTIRIIGDPDVRLQEDPVRMIRAIRHAARTDFQIESETAAAIRRQAPLISKVVKARVYDEFMRDIKGGISRAALPMLKEYGLLKLLLPEVDALLESEDEEMAQVLYQTLERMDRRARNGIEIPTSVALLSLCIDSFASIKGSPGERPGERLKSTIDELYREVGVTKRDREDMESIISLSHQIFRCSQIGRDKAKAYAGKPLIREALLLIELTANNEAGHACIEFWDEVLRSRGRNNRADRNSGGGRPRGRRRPKRRR